jgi:hypothetical protein
LGDAGGLMADPRLYIFWYRGGEIRVLVMASSEEEAWEKLRSNGWVNHVSYYCDTHPEYWEIVRE